MVFAQDVAAMSKVVPYRDPESTGPMWEPSRTQAAFGARIYTSRPLVAEVGTI